MLEQIMKIIQYCWMELKPELGGNYEKLVGWSVFSNKKGGCWGTGKTLSLALADWLFSNREDYSQICPKCAGVFEIVRILKPTKGVCNFCGSGNSHSYIVEVL